MNFLNPIWLWGLLGLAIPIGIHLLSRKEGKTIFIGSLRHLIDSNTTRFSSLRLNEIALLLLRMTIITLIIFLFAGFFLPLNNKAGKKWLLVEKGIERNPRLKTVVDSLQTTGFEMRFLSNGFPLVSDSALIQPLNNYNASLSELQGEQLNEAVIIAYGYANQYKGERIALPVNYKWIGVEPVKENFIQSVTKLSGDSLKVRTGETSGESTAFNTKVVTSTQRTGTIYRHNNDTAQIHQSPVLSVNIFVSPPFEKDARAIIASLEAISEETLIPINITKTAASKNAVVNGNLNFWLSEDSVPSDFRNGIAFRTCAEQGQPILVHTNSASLFCDVTSDVKWILTKRLSQENVLEENFTLSLAKIVATTLSPDDRPLADHRALPTALAWSGSNELSTDKSSATNIDTYLALALLLFLAAERWVAFKRNQ